MLDLSTRIWTDKEGKQTPIAKLGDYHLLNIQRLLKRTVKNKKTYISQRGAYWLGVACAYDAAYYDKDWYHPGSAFQDVEDAAESDFAEIKVSLMLISKEVKKRKLGPLKNELTQRTVQVQ